MKLEQVAPGMMVNPETGQWLIDLPAFVASHGDPVNEQTLTDAWLALFCYLSDTGVSFDMSLAFDPLSLVQPEGAAHA